MSDMRQVMNPDADPMRREQLRPGPPPRAGTLPAEVEAALERVGAWLVCPADGDRVSAHLHHLTAERDALLAECERLRWRSQRAEAERDLLFGEASQVARRARIEALEWVCSQAACADWRDLGERIKAEIERLRGLGGEGAK